MYSRVINHAPWCILRYTQTVPPPTLLLSEQTASILKEILLQIYVQRYALTELACLMKTWTGIGFLHCVCILIASRTRLMRMRKHSRAVETPGSADVSSL